MRTQLLKTSPKVSQIQKNPPRKHDLRGNFKYHQGEEDFYKDYDEVEELDEFFSEPNYLEDYLD